MLLRVNVSILVDVTLLAPIKLEDIYTDLDKAKVKIQDRVVGLIYDWTTESVEEVKDNVSDRSE